MANHLLPLLLFTIMSLKDPYSLQYVRVDTKPQHCPFFGSWSFHGENRPQISLLPHAITQAPIGYPLEITVITSSEDALE